MGSREDAHGTGSPAPRAVPYSFLGCKELVCSEIKKMTRYNVYRARYF